MTPPSNHAVGSTRSKAMLALAALVIASGIGGAAVDRVVVRSEQANMLFDTSYHPLSSVLRSPTNADRQQYREQLRRALKLTPTQDSAIDRVMLARTGEFSALRDEIRPRVDHLVTDVRADIEKVLTDRQRDEFRRLQQRGREQLVSNGQVP